jgi:hypothetical protein
MKQYQAAGHEEEMYLVFTLIISCRIGWDIGGSGLENGIVVAMAERDGVTQFM